MAVKSRILRNQLAHARERAGYSQRGAAKELGRTPETVCRWEKHTVGVPDEQKIRLSRLYDVPVSELWDWR